MSNTKDMSRFLSLILRHKPETIGLKLDKNGWVNVEELINGVVNHGMEIDLSLLKHVVETNDKKRFEFSDDGSKIRASQGHSINVDLQLKTKRPPRILYHGTSMENLKYIVKEGLSKMTRDHVHLSEDFETAERVGSRKKGQTVILEIDTARMFADGVKFYQSSNGVWLTNYVEPKYIS